MAEEKNEDNRTAAQKAGDKIGVWLGIVLVIIAFVVVAGGLLLGGWKLLVWLASLN